MQHSAEAVLLIRESLNLDEMGEARSELPYRLADMMLHIEAVKFKLSIMSNEWNNAVDLAVQEHLKEIEMDFSEEEF